MDGKQVEKGALIEAGKPKKQGHLYPKKAPPWDALIPDLYIDSACSGNEGHDTPM